MHWLKFTPRAARASICGVFTEGFSWFTPTKSARNWSAQIISTLGLREEAEAASTAPAATAALPPTAATAPEARALRRKSRRVGEVFWVQSSVMLRLLDFIGDQNVVVCFWAPQNRSYKTNVLLYRRDQSSVRRVSDEVDLAKQTGAMASISYPHQAHLVQSRTESSWLLIGVKSFCNLERLAHFQSRDTLFPVFC